MTEKRVTPEQVANTEHIAAVISAMHPDKQSILCAITEAVILGAQIGEQCAELARKDAS